MRHLAFTVAGVIVTALLGCGDRKNSETGGVSDTSVTCEYSRRPRAAGRGPRFLVR